MLYIFFFLFANLAFFNYVHALTEIPKEHREMIDNKPCRVLGIGHACMDLLLPIEERFLEHVKGEKGGSERIEYSQLCRLLSLSLEKPKIVTGGSCANAIKGLANLGESCGFISHVGEDALGEHFERYMRQLGIASLFFKSKLPTAQVLCLITPEGQRTMRFCSGCSEEMSGYFLHSDYFQGVKLVHIDAYTFYNGDLVESTMKMAKAARALVSIDLSSYEIVRRFQQPLNFLLKEYVDIVFANQDETKAFTGLDPMEGCFRLQEICPIAVILIGKDGCLVGNQGQVFHSPGFHADVIDTTGAGDLFASGFIFGYLQGYSLEKAAVLGNKLGSAIVEVQGAELPAEKWKEIKEFIITQDGIIP